MDDRINLFSFSVILLFLIAGCSSGADKADSQSQSKPTESVVPVNNIGSSVGEGGTHTILADELTYRDLTQPPSRVRFTLTQLPGHGRIELITDPEKQIGQFTQADLDAGRVVYRHARDHSVSDDFEFSVDNGLGISLPGQRFAIDIITNVSSPDFSLKDGTVYLSWSIPLSKYYAGVEIYRRSDGRYPETPTDGVLIYKATLGEQQTIDVVLIDTNDSALTYYYTIFSYSENGIYSDGVRVGLYCDSGSCVTVPDLREQNRIHSYQDAENFRKALVQQIWGIDALPNWMPSMVYTTTDDRFSNAQKIEQIIAQMDYGLSLQSRMLFFTPPFANGKLVIYHEGHGANPRAVEITQRLLLEGYHVLYVSMPLNGFNWSATLTHDDLAAFDRPMRYFLEPVAVALNYLTSQQSFDGIYMMGISGGGWTTVVYAALDRRITASYPVAGSYPFYLREHLGGSSLGDFEQVNPDFYQQVSYIELYLMGAVGRRQLQIYNEFDTCCFSGTYSNTFKDYLLDSIHGIGGSLDIVIDNTLVDHEISDIALEKILTDIEKN